MLFYDHRAILTEGVQRVASGRASKRPISPDHAESDLLDAMLDGALSKDKGTTGTSCDGKRRITVKSSNPVVQQRVEDFVQPVGTETIRSFSDAPPPRRKIRQKMRQLLVGGDTEKEGE